MTIPLPQPMYLSLRSLRDFFVYFAVSAVFLPQRTRSRRKEHKDFDKFKCSLSEMSSGKLAIIADDDRNEFVLKD